MSTYQNMPLLPLRGNVIFPHIQTKLEIARPQSLATAKYAEQNGRMIFIVSQINFEVENPTDVTRLHRYGVIAEIVNFEMKSDGAVLEIRTLTEGDLSYANLKAAVVLCNVESYEPTVENPEQAEALRHVTEEKLSAYIDSGKNFSNDFLMKAASDKFDVTAWTDIVANEVVYRTSARQQILAERSVETRLEMIAAFITGEMELVKAEKRIANRVKKQVEDGQKEYYLREQMKAISKELGEDENEIAEYRDRIKNCGMPEEVAKKANKEVSRLAKMAGTSPDASVIRNYVDWLCDMPWKKSTEDNKDLTLARQILDEDHYGLEKIKDRIIEYLAVMQLTDKLSGPILCFVGPPGVGKTSIVKSIARSLGRKYLRVSLGGVRDEAEIRGHRRTYVGAIPGKIAYMMKQAGVVNPVLCLDEIDKMGMDNRGDPASAMLEVLDPEQNNTFTDHYLEVPYDLSRVLFVCTANATDDIPAPLLDRMEIIELSGYTVLEKVAIAERFLLDKNLEKHGIPKGALTIEHDAYAVIIEKYTRESGVRNLEREIATICRKAALKLIADRSAKVAVTSGNVEEFLGAPRFKNEEVSLSDSVGSATGLAWTRVGGTTLTVDATLFSGKGEIILTGKLGDVMKESARTAISLVRSLADDYGIDKERFEKTDIHIHVPEGAIPKDGPSAGITMATAVMSAFTNVPVSGKVAMTGEITLRGKVLPIGGLKEKVMAAYRQGIRKVIIPKDNLNDVGEIPSEITSEMQFVYADDITVVFDNALVK